MQQPKVIVLILSYNGKHLLDEAIGSYLNNDYDNFEVAVIDNGSTDNTLAYVNQKWPDVFVLRTEKNLGYSGGLNFGLDYAFNQQHADYVLTTNNDVKADKNVISELLKVALTDDLIGFVTGKVFYYNQPDILQTTGKFGDEKYWRGEHRGNKEKDKGQYDEIQKLEWCDDIFWLISKKVYKITGGYDETFQFQAEDFDWQARAKNEGYWIYYTPKAKIWHKDSFTIGKSSPFKLYFDCRNPLIVHLKHRKAKQVKTFMHKTLKNNITLSFRHLSKFHFIHFLAIWKGFFSAIFWGIKNKKLTIKHFI